MTEKMGQAGVVPKEMAILRLLEQMGPLSRQDIQVKFITSPKAVKFTDDELKEKLTALHNDLFIQRKFVGEDSPPVFDLTEHGKSCLGPISERDFSEVARDATDDPEVVGAPPQV